MANDWTKNVYALDTAEDKTITAFIQYMEWHPSAADDDLQVLDSAGNILWQIRALAGAGNDEAEGIERSPIIDRWVQGINLATIDGGTLYVYTK